jgi:hypothetical protein
MDYYVFVVDRSSGLPPKVKVVPEDSVDFEWYWENASKVYGPYYRDEAEDLMESLREHYFDT